MPLDFLKRRPKAAARATPPEPLPEEISAQDHTLTVHYRAKSSDGVRIKAGPRAVSELPSMLVGQAQSEIEVVEALPVELAEAAPVMIRPSEAMQWLNAHHGRSPVARHALDVLEHLDAIDLAFDTFVCSLLHGETDTAGYPEYNAIVGGVASHWDEATGDMIVRAVVAWGGKGVRGDTDRVAGKILAGLFANVLAHGDVIGVAPDERPVPAAGRGGLVCAHCGFASAHERAFYCPKCGMRLLRG